MARRTKAQKERDRAALAELYLKGHTQRDIAAAIGISASQVCRDLRLLHEQWFDSQLSNMSQAKAEQLAKLDLLEREAWEEWDRSKLDKSGQSIESAPLGEADEEGPVIGGQKRKVWTEGRLGDPRYLVAIQRCIDQRCKILGLDGPAVTDPLKGTAATSSRQLSPEELERVKELAEGEETIH